MAFEKCFAQEWKSISAAAATAESDNLSGGFECNICLDFVREPVVTLCGHLYCWPCIYKWFHFQRDSLASDDQPQCPVCKAEISHTSLVPLYGRGHTPDEAEIEGKASAHGVAIPPRPAACNSRALMNTSHRRGRPMPYHNPYQNQQYSPYPYSSYEEEEEEEESSLPSFSHGSSGAAMGAFHPMVGMFGEMIYARVFGNSESLYAYPNSYHLSGSSSPRLRRQEMQADKSLNRISIFLFCCFLLCLALF